ncbi:MAG: pyridoxamine 5'-phosphate oxidase family protein [Chitinophagaceae bacterium]|nr:pyridoxamine 5'-phosphate oxidase family protein [Chitinophagaceae bacterium]
MATRSLSYISTKMREIDICMMSTSGARGKLSARPMSNNKDVKYNGESFFFSLSNTQKVKDIQQNKSVTLSFIGKKGAFIIVSGKAKLITTKATMEAHWVPDLEQWFADGLETKGLVLIAVKAQKIHYWFDYKEGELKVK